MKLVIGTWTNMQLKVARGYTLIEILVVVAIISIVSGVALLSIHSHSQTRIETFAKQLTQKLRATEEQALLQSTILGVLLKHRNLQFYHYAANDWQSWPTQFSVPDDIKLRLQTPTDNTQTPQIIFSTNGDSTPFILSINNRYKIIGETSGTITLSKI